MGRGGGTVRVRVAGAPPLIIGHRGASSVAPENTLAAFARALADGADGLEFDVRLAADGVPVVVHDTTLERTALRRDRVASLSSADLADIEVGSWFNRRFPARSHPTYARERVPLLSHVLTLFAPRCRALYIEIKCAPAEATAHARAVVEALRADSLAACIAIVESFTLEAIAEVKRLAPELHTAALFERSIRRPLPPARSLAESALAHDANEIALHRSLVTPRAVEVARAAGLPVVVWTVDHPSWARRAAQLGLRALITNRPARLRESLNVARAAESEVGTKDRADGTCKSG